MPLPIICAYECLQQYLMSYRDLFSKPQYKYFVIVLLGFLQCQQARTLSGLHRCVADGGSLSGLSRFFTQAPWEAQALMVRWQERFCKQMTPAVQAELTRLQEEQPKRCGQTNLHLSEKMGMVNPDHAHSPLCMKNTKDVLPLV